MGGSGGSSLTGGRFAVSGGGVKGSGRYPVSAIFRSLQGEGHFVGYPMTFVRLAGCSVRDCHIRAECDEAPWKATSSMTADEIADRCAAESFGRIVCITGGEPSDHDLVPLVDALRERKLSIHMETSGVRALVDGTGWFTKKGGQAADLVRFFEHASRRTEAKAA